MHDIALIVDDDKAMTKTLKLMLESWDLQVDTAYSGEEAVTKLSERQYDIILSDIRMPGMSGHDLLEQVTESDPDIPMVLLTSHGSVESAVDAMKVGAFDYILKPLKGDELRLIVQRALENRQLKKENSFLRAEMASMGLYGDRILGKSSCMQEVFDLISRVAQTDSTVLITGETGTGKELVAQTIHYKGKRADKPMMACNCAALHENLLESELFGHEKGAFTGALATRRGRFEDADGGTIFLDEIGETSREFQANLLRVLQEGTFERVGGNASIKSDVRVIASTNRNLEQEVEEGRFREDLYYRLRVVPVHLPPLREREGDIILLADYFLEKYGKQYGGQVTSISKAGKDLLLQCAWKGNVRELQHTIERAVILSPHAELEPEDLQLDAPTRPAAKGPNDRTLQSSLDHATQEHIVSVLDETGWQKKKAAEILGIDRATLYRLLKKFSIER